MKVANIAESSTQHSAAKSIDTSLVSHINVTDSPRIRCIKNILQLEVDFEAGYDSDGQCGPFVNIEDIEGEQMFDEIELKETKDGEIMKSPTLTTNDDASQMDISNADGDDTGGDSTTPPHHTPIDEADLLKLTREGIKMSYASEDSVYLETRWSY